MFPIDTHDKLFILYVRLYTTTIYHTVFINVLRYGRRNKETQQDADHRYMYREMIKITYI